MSQVNVNSGGPGYRDGGSSAAAAGINLVTMLIVLAVVVAIAVVVWGATAGNWFSGPSTNSSNTSVTISAPARAPAQPVSSR